MKPKAGRRGCNQRFKLRRLHKVAMNRSRTGTVEAAGARLEYAWSGPTADEARGRWCFFTERPGKSWGACRCGDEVPGLRLRRGKAEQYIGNEWTGLGAFVYSRQGHPVGAWQAPWSFHGRGCRGPNLSLIDDLRPRPVQAEEIRRGENDGRGASRWWNTLPNGVPSQSRRIGGLRRVRSSHGGGRRPRIWMSKDAATGKIQRFKLRTS